MKDDERKELAGMVLAPYIQKATALIGHRRAVGGNQFRHAMATLAILIDYRFIDPVLLKAACIHDLFEDAPETDSATIEAIDADGPAVVKLVWELTRRNEDRESYLERLRHRSTRRAKLLKLADRISNLTDLHQIIFPVEYIRRYLDETERFVYPIACAVNVDMATEIKDLIQRRREQLASRRGR